MRKWAVGTGIALLTAVLVGCAPAVVNGTDESAPEETETVHLKAAGFAGVDSIPLFLAAEQGFFADEGLEVEVGVAGGGQAVPMIVSGELDFGLEAVMSALAAVGEGIPIKMLAPTSYYTEENPAVGMIVAPGIDYQRPADLQGLRVAANPPKGSNHLSIMAAVLADGGDPSLVDVTFITASEQVEAIRAGRIDVGWTTEPAFAVARLDPTVDGLQTFPIPWSAVSDRGALGNAVLASDQFLSEQPEVAEKVVRALQRAAKFAVANPEEARKVLLTFMDVSEEVASEMLLPEFTGDPFEIGDIQRLIDLEVELGWLTPERTPNAEDMVWQP